MIDQNTTKVFVRVDLASMRVVSVSADTLIGHPGQPVFPVAANFSKLEYYIVVKNPAKEFGIEVRPATEAERVAVDARQAEVVSATTRRIKAQKAIAIRDFYVDMLIARFVTSSFMSDDEITSAATYVGTDAHMVNVVKPLAIKIDSAYNEWRFNVCQPVIDAMKADQNGTGVELNEIYRATIQDALDAFLVERGFDLATYHR